MATKILNKYNVSANVPAQMSVLPGSVSGSFSLGQSSSSLAWDIEDDGTGIIVQRFIADTLGFSSATRETIHRGMPARHPYIPWLFASHISQIQTIGPKSQVIFSNPDPNNGEKIAMEVYKHWRFTVVYETPTYAILTDAQINRPREEWRRFVFWDQETSVQMIQQTQGGFKYPPEAAGIFGLDGGQVIAKAGGLSTRLIKKKVVLNWLMVPDVGLFGRGGISSGQQPVNLDAGLGRINKYNWPTFGTYFGYPRGTLLFEGYKITPRTMPNIIPPDFANLIGDPPVFIVNRAWDVRLEFSYFDPPPADSSKRGHNLVPLVAATALSGILWYRILLNADIATDTPPFWKYQEYDFDNLFAMVP